MEVGRGLIIHPVQMVEEDCKGHCRVGMEALEGVVGNVIQHLEKLSLDLVEASNHPVVHPEVGPVGERVAVLFAHRQARVG